MKKNKFFQDKKKDITAFMCATLVVLGTGYFCAADDIKASCLCQHQVTVEPGTKVLAQGEETAQPKELANAMRELEKIAEKKAKLETQKEKYAYQLKKAKTKRDTNYGMVPGIGYSAPQGLSEVICLERKMNSIDNKIGRLSKSENEIVAKYGKDIQKKKCHSLLALGDQ